ncbi:hypothetical protein DMC30DRAFT_294098 [Rhodotorula diobovata]|uniref:Uncharacterized protein n=1 Tax=Rhodotorula diobovata TaxID=5288 RepID=A0A5C5G3S8_9BASI|nr:hypothetical protein DMC30DRAFT_294098 [Rhodotorula diobovata]
MTLREASLLDKPPHRPPLLPGRASYLALKPLLLPRRWRAAAPLRKEALLRQVRSDERAVCLDLCAARGVLRRCALDRRCARLVLHRPSLLGRFWHEDRNRGGSFLRRADGGAFAPDAVLDGRADACAPERDVLGAPRARVGVDGSGARRRRGLARRVRREEVLGRVGPVRGRVGRVGAAALNVRVGRWTREDESARGQELRSDGSNAYKREASRRTRCAQRGWRGRRWRGESWGEEGACRRFWRVGAALLGPGGLLRRSERGERKRSRRAGREGGPLAW